MSAGVATKRPKPSGDADASKPPVLYLRITPEHEAAIQAFLGRQRVRPDRTAVGLTALEEFLAKEGLWPPKPAR